jgi:hypothetical protein
LIISQAKILFQNSLARVGHVWVLAALFAFADQFLPSPLGKFPLLAWIVGSAFIEIWFKAATIRGLMHDRRFVWSLDGDFWRYFGVKVVLASPFALIGVAGAFIPLPRGVAVVLTIAVGILLIRFSLWPVGLLLGYRQMTASESARLMTGRILPMIGAIVIFVVYLLVPVLLFSLVAMIVTMMSYDSLRLPEIAVQIGNAVASVLAMMASTTISAAMYKLTAELADADSQTHTPQGGGET